MIERKRYSSLTAALGGLTRRASSTEELLVEGLAEVAVSVGATHAIMYLGDNGVPDYAAIRRGHQLFTEQMTPVALYGDWSLETQIPTVCLERATALMSDDDFTQVMGSPHRRPRHKVECFVIRDRDAVVKGCIVAILPRRCNRAKRRAVMQSLVEFTDMLVLVCDRYFHKELFSLHKVGLSTLGYDPQKYISKILELALGIMKCEGISFFLREDVSGSFGYRLVGTAPCEMPSASILYRDGDGTITSSVLSNRWDAIINTLSSARTGLNPGHPSKWKDIPSASSTSVMLTTVAREEHVAAFLRCTNKQVDGLPFAYFNELDRRRASALTAVLLTMYSAAQGEHRFATSLLDIAHEIKTRASGITYATSFVELELRRRDAAYPESEIAHKLHHVHSAVESLLKLLPAMQIGVGPEGDSSTSARHPFRPYADLCKPIAEQFREQARQKNVTLSFAGKDQLGLLHADLEDFRYIIYNLISNAVKYAIPGSDVTISLERAGSSPFAKIHVLGISLPILRGETEAIFQFRYRAAAARKSNIKGEGQGLPIARAKARHYHGDVTYRSHDAYNVFSLLIPRALFHDSPP